MNYNNAFIKKLISGFGWFWQLVSAIPPLRRLVNRFFIKFLSERTKARPHPLSLWGPAPNPGTCADYVSWTGLVDRSYTGRHLPPADDAYLASLPAEASLDRMFRRGATMTPCPKSTALFGFFAQWFTDSFLRTDPVDVRRNTSNHEIDLCQIYGLNAADASIIRSHRGGELKSQPINGQEYPPYLFNPDGRSVKDEFLGLSYIDAGKKDFLNEVLKPPFNTPDRKAKLFVAGLERGNSTILYSAINTVFLREHNRLCREMAERHSTWDDDRLFETARNTNIVQLLQIIIQDYINHLSPAQFRMFVEIGFAEKQHWYRTNRICAEFNLLYRWHQLVPGELTVSGQVVPQQQFQFNNELLVQRGTEAVIAAAATAAAGRITLKNTAPFLVPADLAAVSKSRAWRIRSYNEYRSRFGLPVVTSFEELTGDAGTAAELEDLYKHVNRVELLVGLLAEQRGKKEMLGDLMTLMVAVDAFSQALTNPLLSENVHGEQCFSDVGMYWLARTNFFDDMVQRNTSLGPRQAMFTKQPVPGSYGLPILGTIVDTVDFLLVSGWEKFFLRRQRKYGSTVFRMRMFQPTIAMLDDRAISSLVASGDLIQDLPTDGFQFQIPPLPLLGDVSPSMFEAGPAHDRPKALYLRLLRERSATLVEQFDSTLNEFIGRWLSLKQFGFRDELETFVVTFIFRWILGKNPDPEEVRYLYSNIFSHWAVALTKYLPWSAYSRSLRIYRRLLGFVRSSPGFEDVLRIAGDEGLADDERTARLITYVLGMNSFLGNQSALKSVIGELSLRPDLRATLRAEISAALGPEPKRLDLAKLGAMPLLDRTLREILRLHPPVFFIYGRATRDRVIESASGTFAIAKGELLLGVIPISQRDAAIFAQPEQFDPDRFLEPAASDHLIWPRGLHDGQVAPHDRTCPGKDVGILIAKLFCIALLPGFEWQLKNPPRWGRHFFTLNVAAPCGPLEVTSFERISEPVQRP